MGYDLFFNKKSEFKLEPFPIIGRLCSKFQSFELKLGTDRPKIVTKLSFSMPFIKPPNMIPNINEETL